MLLVLLVVGLPSEQLDLVVVALMVLNIPLLLVSCYGEKDKGIVVHVLLVVVLLLLVLVVVLLVLLPGPRPKHCS